MMSSPTVENFYQTIVKTFGIADPPEKLLPLDDAIFKKTVCAMDFRKPVDAPFLEGMGVDDAEELLEVINGDLRAQLNTRSVSFENRNLVAISGNALVIHFRGWVVKYPLNVFLKPILEQEVEKHKCAHRLCLEWQADPKKHKLSFDPREKFAIPNWEVHDGIYRIEYVGRSLDVLSLQIVIRDIDPKIDQRLEDSTPKMSLGQMTPVQLSFFLKAILKWNFPDFEEEDVMPGEFLPALIACAPKVLESAHHEALNSFLDYCYDHGFVYLDKIADNSTLDKNQIFHLIDYGVSQLYDREEPPFSFEEYQQLRQELIEQQIQAFVQQ